MGDILYFEKTYSDGFFNVSGDYGFLPIRDPLKTLPSEYNELQKLIDDLHVIQSDGKTGILGIPNEIDGAHVVYNGSTFNVMMSPPFSQENYTAKFIYKETSALSVPVRSGPAFTRAYSSADSVPIATPPAANAIRSEAVYR